MNKKQIIRTKIRKKRDGLNKEKQTLYNSKLTKNFKSIFENISGLTVFTYISTQSEVKTPQINKYLAKTECKVYVPSIKNDEIIPVKVYDGCKYIKGEFGIKEPEKKYKCKSLKEIDLVVIPGIAFDIKGNRIGFGKGFFDKFLKKLSKNSLKVALAYDFQVADAIPSEKHDVKVDMIITEKGVIPINKKLFEGADEK